MITSVYENCKVKLRKSGNCQSRFKQTKAYNKMANYHKLEAKLVQELKDIANRLRIHSVQSTDKCNSGWVW